MTEVATETAAPPGMLARLGLAILHPRWALAIAADRRRAGGSGSDLLAVIALVILATQLRWFVRAGWLAAAGHAGLGARLAAGVLTEALTVDLAFLLVGAILIYFAAGARRDLGRAFDLACVAVLPLLFVNLAANAIAFAAEVEPDPLLGWMLFGIAFAWTGVLLALAIGPARTATARAFVVPRAMAAPARWAGAVVAVLVVFGLATQVRWVASHTSDVRPLTNGGTAPAFSLPRIQDDGTLGAPVTLASLAGRPVVVDFWATWCNPCLASLPLLDAFTKAHPEVSVVAVNLDNPALARAEFAKHGYTMMLVAGGDDISRTYEVATIPHTVVIDAAGQIRKVGHIGDIDLDGTIEALGK